jgi:hypothetical protein
VAKGAISLGIMFNKSLPGLSNLKSVLFVFVRIFFDLLVFSRRASPPEWVLPTAERRIYFVFCVMCFVFFLFIGLMSSF